MSGADGDASPEISWSRIISVGVINMAQTFPAIFIAGSVAAIFRSNGLPLHMLWVLSLPQIPYIFKWAWAPLVDRYGSERFGLRRSWLLPTTLAGTAIYLVLAQINPEPDMLWIMVGFLIVKSFVMATQDIAVNAYTIEHMNDRDRHLGSAAVTIGKAAADVVALGGLMTMYDHFGWQPTATLAALLMLTFTMPAILRPERPQRPRQRLESRPGAHFQAIKFAALRPEGRLILPLFLMNGFSFPLLTSFAVVMLVDKGFTFTEIGITGMLAYGTGVAVGNIYAAFVLQRLSVHTNIILGIIFAFIGATAFGLYALFGPTEILWALIASFFNVVCLAPLQLSIKSATYQWPSTRQSGTDYTVWGAAGNAGDWLALAIAGFIASVVGWGGLFFFAGICMVGTGIYLLRIHDPVMRAIKERREGNNAARAAPAPEVSETGLSISPKT